jgi:hypothetical protein
MSVTISLDKSDPGTKPVARCRKQPGGATLVQDASRTARQLAAAILEVLAGARTPLEAATALNVSLPRYYQVESRALKGLLTACEAKPKGRTRSPQRDLETLRQQNERLERELMRQQALVRVTQRTMGLPAPQATAPAAKSGKKMRKRRVARALSVATRLRHDNQQPLPVVPASPVTTL